MKIKILLLGFSVCMFFNIQAQESKVAKTFNDIYQIIHAVNNAVNGGLKDLGSTTITINSTSKAYFGGGHTRGVVQVQLPRGTEKWFYRITVLDVKSNYSHSYNYLNLLF